MIILIAESKTMASAMHEISTSEYLNNTPAGERQAAEIMKNIASMSVADISRLVKLSDKMAASLRLMAYEFPNKTAGMKAVEAFTGVVFRNLDYPSFSEEEKMTAGDKIRIISSLYGWLRPDDVIKPYRLEFTSPLSPDDTPLARFWRGSVTDELVRMIKDSGEKEVLDLLPADAAKSIDWKIVKSVANVWKVDFKELSGENVRSPHAGKLKSFRGKLLRQIILNRLDSAAAVASFENDEMMPAPEYGEQGRIAYYV